jgi:hypothetical protein
MARTRPKPVADQERLLHPASPYCAACGKRKRMQIAYHNKRCLLTMQGHLALTVPVRRCRHPECRAFKKPVRPFEEGALALPQSECGLDLIAFVGHYRYAKHQSLLQIHQALLERDIRLCERSVCNLLHRYEELVALGVAASVPRLRAQGRVVLAIDGLQPDKGHEVLWVLRDCLSGTILLARSLLSAAQDDLASLIREVKEALPVPICAVISDGQNSLRPAMEAVLPGVPHQLCQFHYLREAARPVYEADRQAKKELKKRVRGIRPLEHALSDKDDEEAQVIRGYCLAVRSALTDDGQPPLEAPGLRLHERLTAIATSLSAVEKKGDCPDRSSD